MTIYIVPIEPLEERYSADWIKWFPKEMDGKDYCFIWGKVLTDKIERGSWLDVCSTNFWKASQLMEITSLIYHDKIKHNDSFLFLDLWFPGLEMLAYMRQGLGSRFKITGCLHAGTYDPYDFLSKQGMASWGKLLEESWFDFVDQIFVATKFHKFLITDNRIINTQKIAVTGFPIYTPNIPTKKKEQIVIFPHRLDTEKNPHLFDILKNKFSNTNWKFLKTAELWQGKKDIYYDLLSKSKVSISFADQETWGIAMQESIFLNCIPIVPNRLSYREMFHPNFRYNSIEECYNKVDSFMKNFDQISKSDIFIDNKNALLIAGKKAISNILRSIDENLFY